MKIKKLLSLLLVFATLTLLLAACGAKEKEEEPKETEAVINPELINAFGEEFINGEKETIAKLVAELEGYYKQYQKDKDLYQACANLETFFGKYDSYFDEISDELMPMMVNETDKEKKTALIILHGQSIGHVAAQLVCSNYKFYTDNGMSPNHSDEEVEKNFFSCIDSISEFFYCKPITK